jgi:arylsulfatase A-like enzyme
LDDRPNVLIIVLDTLRRDVVSPYASDGVTPGLMAFAKDALVFGNAVSTSDWTLPAHASVLTGQLPSRHGVNYSAGHRNLRGRPSMAVRMREAGYRTVGLTNNPWFSGLTSLDEGFDHFHWVRSGEGGLFVPINFLKFRMFDNFGRAPPTFRKRLVSAMEWTVRGRHDDGARETARELVSVVDHGGRPWFAMVNLMEAHGPFIPPQPYRARFAGDESLGRLVAINQDAFNYHFGQVPMTDVDFRTLLALYRAEVAYLDQVLGELFAALTRRGLLDDTLVIVTSDHGENFGEHGLMEHRWCLYDTLVHIPFMMRLPRGHGDRARGVDTAAPVQLCDIYPTVAPFAGIDVGETDGVQGVDVLAGAREFAISEMVPRQLPVKQLPKERWERFSFLKVCLRTGGRKLIWSPDERHEYYDLSKDPGERENLFDPDDREQRELLDRVARESDLDELAGQAMRARRPTAIRSVADKLATAGHAK